MVWNILRDVTTSIFVYVLGWTEGFVLVDYIPQSGIGGLYLALEILPKSFSK